MAIAEVIEDRHYRVYGNVLDDSLTIRGQTAVGRKFTYYSIK